MTDRTKPGPNAGVFEIPEIPTQRSSQIEKDLRADAQHRIRQWMEDTLWRFDAAGLDSTVALANMGAILLDRVAYIAAVTCFTWTPDEFGKAASEALERHRRVRQ